MIKISYYNRIEDKTVEIRRSSGDDLPDLLGVILGLGSRRGHPTLELVHESGASLSLSTDGERSYLVWINSLGESFHSVGSSEGEGVSLIFDYFGSWSEAPQQYLVSFEDAMRCARSFVLTGRADTERVLFEPD